MRDDSRAALVSYARSLVPRSLAEAAPGVAFFLRYPRSYLRSDVVAGVTVGAVAVSPYNGLRDGVREHNIIVGVLAVPAASAQQAANDLVGAGVKIIFNYSEALLDVPGDVQVHTSNPAVELLYALYFHLT